MSDANSENFTGTFERRNSSLDTSKSPLFKKLSTVLVASVVASNVSSQSYLVPKRRMFQVHEDETFLNLIKIFKSNLYLCSNRASLSSALFYLSSSRFEPMCKIFKKIPSKLSYLSPSFISNTEFIST